MIGPPTSLDEFVELTNASKARMAVNRVNKKSRFTFKRKLSEEPGLVMSNLMADTGLSLFSLHDAVEQGNHDIVRKYEQNPSCSDIMNILNDEGLGPLHISARRNDVRTAMILLELGARVNIHGKDDLTPLHLAVRYNCLETVELLVQHGADINSPTTDGFTPLHVAAKRSYEKLLEILLSTGCTDVNSRDSNDNTALHYACASGKSKAVELFLRARADVLPINSDKRTPLHCATYVHGNVEILQLIIKRVNERHVPLEDYVNRKDFQGDSALHLAAENGYEEAVEILIQNRANVNDMNNERQTPLHLAAVGGHLNVVENLITHKATVQCIDENGRTPLHNAAAYGKLDVVKFLIRKGGKVNKGDKDTMTPLVCALENGRTECVEYLIRAKANVNVRTENSKTCLHFAVEAESEESLTALLNNGAKSLICYGDLNESTPLHYAAMLQSSKFLGILLDYTDTTVVKDHAMSTILHIAVEYGSLQNVQVLCERAPVLINETDDAGRTPLHIAATQNRRKISNCLLRHGAHLSAKDDNRQTPVHYAAKYGNNKVLSDMLRYNAPLELVDSRGHTALHTATQHAQNDTVQLLIDSGADILARNDEGLTCLEMAIENQDSLIATKIVKHTRGREILKMRGIDGHRPMKKLIERLPDVAEVIMDNSIDKSLLPRIHPDYAVSYDFWLLDPGPDDESSLEGNRFFAPKTMAKYKREKLLNHPLCKTMLKQKWKTFGRNMYIAHFAAYFLFLLSFIIFIVIQRDMESLGVLRFEPSSKTSQPTLNVSNSTGAQPKSLPPAHIMTIKDSVCTYLFAFAIFHLALELLQLLVQRQRYCKNPLKLMNWTTYVTSIIFVIDYVPHIRDVLHVDPDVRWTCGIIASFFGFLGLLIFLQNSSFLGGMYISMFFDVCKTLLMVLGMFIMFIVGFAVVFHILLKEQEPFETLGLSALKILDMTIGEIDFISLFIDSEDQTSPEGVPLLPYPLTSRIFFVIFCLMMPIILMNLLVGLAVGDIETIRKNAVLHRLNMRVNFLYDIETKYPRALSRFFYQRQLTVKPNQRNDSGLCHLRKRKSRQERNESDVENTNDQGSDLLILKNEIRKQKLKTKAMFELVNEQQTLLSEMNEKIDNLVKRFSESEGRQRPHQPDESSFGSTTSLSFANMLLSGSNNTNADITRDLTRE